MHVAEPGPSMEPVDLFHPFVKEIMHVHAVAI